MFVFFAHREMASSIPILQNNFIDYLSFVKCLHLLLLNIFFVVHNSFICTHLKRFTNNSIRHQSFACTLFKCSICAPLVTRQMSSRLLSSCQTRCSMSQVILSSVEVILCLSSSMLAGRGGGQKLVPDYITIKRNHTRTGRVTAAAISWENCLHLDHALSISLGDYHWDKHSIIYKLLICFYTFCKNFRLFQLEGPKLLACGIMLNFFGNLLYIYIYIYTYISCTYIYIYIGSIFSCKHFWLIANTILQKEETKPKFLKAVFINIKKFFLNKINFECGSCVLICL